MRSVDAERMAAGESARREYDRRAAAHARVVRRTFPFLVAALAIVVPVVAFVAEGAVPGSGPWLALLVGIGIVRGMWPRRAHVDSWAKGAVGEVIVGRTLAKLGDEYVVMHDLRIPGTRANIDHVVIGPSGVFVVETKHVTGTVRVERGELFIAGRRRGYGAQAWREADVVEQAILELTTRMGLHVRPIVCFTKAHLPARDMTVVGVPLLGPKGMLKTIAGGPRRIDDARVQEIAAALTKRLRPA